LQTKLIIIGSGELEDSLKSLADRLDLGQNVIFLGDINHDDLPRYLSVGDVFVRHSLSEGLGNAFLEAMACGIPVIGTPVGGIVDFIESLPYSATYSGNLFVGF